MGTLTLPCPKSSDFYHHTHDGQGMTVEGEHLLLQTPTIRGHVGEWDEMFMG